MITIYKYPIKMTELFWLDLPAGSKVIHVDVQRDEPMMWIKVDTVQPLRETIFGVFGTGRQMDAVDEDGNLNPVAHAPHIGSFMLQNGNLVFHLFGGIYSSGKQS